MLKILEFRPKFILIIIEFQYHSQKNKDVPNAIRQTFLGIKKGSPKVPQVIKEKAGYNRQVILPIHFALIKKPVTIELTEINVRKTRNTAVGAMILYEFLGRFQDFNKILKLIDGLIKEKIEAKNPSYFGVCTDYQIIIGEDLKNVKI